jgi:hypothetical protein
VQGAMFRTVCSVGPAFFGTSLACDFRRVEVWRIVLGEHFSFRHGGGAVLDLEYG